MQVDQIKTKFEQADQELEAAKAELCRPAEDVVPFMVCRSSRNAISHYLQGFLLKRGLAFDEGASVDSLLEKCRTVENTFDSFDLSPLKFDMDGEYSAEFDEMQACIDLAALAKKLVG